MKTARRSFNKEPYNCLKPWPEDCFCQCGGNGVVFTDNSSMGELLTNPKDQQEAIKAVLGEESKKTHYKTAFFEAFPKNPSCFIRGEGKTIEEAEENKVAVRKDDKTIPPFVIEFPNLVGPIVQITSLSLMSPLTHEVVHVPFSLTVKKRERFILK